MSVPTLPICVKCNLKMKPDTNGVTVLLMAYDPPQPYEAYAADLVKCPNCGIQVIAGYAFNANWRNHNDEGPPPDVANEKVFPVYEKIGAVSEQIKTPPEQPVLKLSAYYTLNVFVCKECNKNKSGLFHAADPDIGPRICQGCHGQSMPGLID